MPFEPHEEITVRLTVTELNAALRLLRRHGKYDVVAPIIAKIMTQAEAQAATRDAPPAEPPDPPLLAPNVTTLTQPADSKPVRRVARNQPDGPTPPP